MVEYFPCSHIRSHISKFKSLYPHSHRIRDCNKYCNIEQNRNNKEPSHQTELTWHNNENKRTKRKKCKEKTGSNMFGIRDIVIIWIDRTYFNTSMLHAFIHPYRVSKTTWLGNNSSMSIMSIWKRRMQQKKKIFTYTQTQKVRYTCTYIRYVSMQRQHMDCIGYWVSSSSIAKSESNSSVHIIFF